MREHLLDAIHPLLNVYHPTPTFYFFFLSSPLAPDRLLLPPPRLYIPGANPGDCAADFLLPFPGEGCACGTGIVGISSVVPCPGTGAYVAPMCGAFVAVPLGVLPVAELPVTPLGGAPCIGI